MRSGYSDNGYEDNNIIEEISTCTIKADLQPRQALVPIAERPGTVTCSLCSTDLSILCGGTSTFAFGRAPMIMLRSSWKFVLRVCVVNETGIDAGCVTPGATNNDTSGRWSSLAQ